MEVARVPNAYKVSDDGKYCVLLSSRGEQFLIDWDDHERISRYTWHLGKRGYPVTHIKRKTHPLHRVLLDFPDGYDVDHISGDKLDNRRANLRVCTHQENMCNQKMRNTNTSGYMGVSYLRCAGKYEAYVHCDGKKHYLGLFASPREAAIARDKAAHTLFGQYARLNLPLETG